MSKVKPVCLNLSECNGLGDLICATPVIKKISEAYGSKITVLSKMPEVFKNNPHVEKSYKSSSVDMEYFEENYLMHNSFYNMGKKNEKGVEYKHNRIDIRQMHAINLGFTLLPSEMDCFYEPTEPCKHIIESNKYVVIHPVTTWESRTWSAENWMLLTKKLNDRGIYVVSIGKDSSETGFFNVDKPVFNFEIEHGINLMNKTSISDCWHIISSASCFVTMDSGLLHLGATTPAHIIQLGSSINPYFRVPYRNGVQGEGISYVHGTCPLFCASDMKYGVGEWGSIQGVPPLIKCLENKPTYECHPTVEQVLYSILYKI
jgi:hypothetical protein